MILVIAEKPKAAKKIAEALGNYRTHKGGDSYYYQVGSVYVVPAVGHVYGLVPKTKSWTYPVFDVEWRPSYEKKGLEYTRSYIRNLEKLGKGAEEVIIATDYDNEGAVIGYNVARFALGISDPRKLKRMKFSTLTPGELRRAFKEAHPHNPFEVGMINAGLLRHYLDWFWGINMSRALMRSQAGFRVLSTGRVQGPTLKILVDREREIKKFDSKYFYRLLARLGKFTAEGPELEDVERALSAFLSLRSPARVASVEKRQSKVEQPSPFNLTDLQTEASRAYGYTPKRTLELAQKLYEDGLISYPRTSSQKLPKDLDLKAILRALSRKYPFAEGFIGRPYKEGKKTDPAHPAIYPTGQLPHGRPPQEEKLYDLVVRRFLASFSEPALRESTKVVLDISGQTFVIKGIRTVKPGFTSIYPAGLEEKDAPDVREGQELPVGEFELRREQKKPPKRYTAAGLLKLMEKLNLGTKATRAAIIQTLYDRGYIEGKSIRVLELGEKVVELLEKRAPDIVSVELTRRFEELMQQVHEGRVPMEKVLEEAKEELTRLLKEFDESREKVQIRTTAPPGAKHLGRHDCNGDVYALKSRAGKRYARCYGCDQTWGLPQRGTMKVLDKNCRQCSLKLVQITRKDAKFRLCIEHGFH